MLMGTKALTPLTPLTPVTQPIQIYAFAVRFSLCSYSALPRLLQPRLAIATDCSTAHGLEPLFFVSAVSLLACMAQNGWATQAYQFYCGRAHEIKARMQDWQNAAAT